MVASAATAPLPPARFSTMTGWPRFFDISLATRRARMSVPPPGAKATMKRMGLEGKLSCAKALPTVRVNSARKNRLNIFRLLKGNLVGIVLVDPVVTRADLVRMPFGVDVR